jgi:putative ABC transport system ATP-binding protein
MENLYRRRGEKIDEEEQPNTDHIIELENIQKTYLLGIEGVPALRGVSFKIRRGEFVIIYGTSGGGKTSMLNIIGTIDKPTKGHLTIDGIKIGSKTPDSTLAHIRLRKMGFVFQTFNLLATMTALENVEMPMILRGTLTASERRERAIELLTKVGMADRLHHIPAQLSGGEQQRVTIARAIANEPDILLLDEPTGDLDTQNTINVMDLLLQLNEEEAITLVMVTHDPNLKNAAKRVIYMRDGKIDRVEDIADSVRSQFRDKIRQELRLHGKLETNAKRRGRFTSATVLRKPQNYETFDQAALNEAQLLLERHQVQKNQVSSPLIDGGDGGGGAASDLYLNIDTRTDVQDDTIAV